MSYKEIEINFSYESQPIITFKCKPNEIISQVCQAFASKIDINFNSLLFLLDGKSLEKADFDEPITKFIRNENILSILVYNNPNAEEKDSLNLNKKIHIIFWYKSEPIVINCFPKSKMADICKSFAIKANKDLNLLSFSYMNKKLNLEKNFDEIATKMDINRKQMEIQAEEIDNKVEENNINRDNQTTFFKNNFKILLIILLIIIVVVVVIVSILFLKNKKEEEGFISGTDEKIETDKIIVTEKLIEITQNIIKTDTMSESETEKIIQNEDTENFKHTNAITKTDESKENETIIKKKCNERCSLCDSSKEECLACKEDFDLYNGECILYAFYGIYNITNYYEDVELYSEQKADIFTAMKIENNMLTPNKEYTFPERKKYIVYFYIPEKYEISLSYLFNKNKKIIDFSFNNKYMNNFYIIDINAMFESNSALVNISLDFSNFNLDYFKEMKYLFYYICFKLVENYYF